MGLNKQIFCYSVDTNFFYSAFEENIDYKLSKFRKHKQELKKDMKKINKQIKKIETNMQKNKTASSPKTTEELENLKKKQENRTEHITKTNKWIQKIKQKLCGEFSKNTNIRHLNKSKLSPKNIIAIFDSALTRTIGITEATLSMEMFIVKTFYFEILEDIILNGFYYNNAKYVCFTASAGQIRTKKTVFIKESTLNQIQNSLMCGLTIEEINKHGGINVNKYLAYLALSNSATEWWKEFNINKAIVVEDMETMVNGLVDFIHEDTFIIERKRMDIPINHTDGCGMILPTVSNKSFMIRLPWMKGLLIPFDYVRFIRENSCSGKVKDIYGKEWDILADDIQVIFTKSQFKMYKYYTSWKDYCDKFNTYNCQAGKCNQESEFINDAKINYQMLQTLTDMTDSELRYIASKTQTRIDGIGTSKNIMYKVLGVTPYNKNKNYVQQAIEIYPNIIRDSYFRKILEDTKASLVKDAKSARLDVDGKYMFICPDLYAFCEYLFTNQKNPQGLLKDGEVYCNIYKDRPRLDCLRSPHLYREHAVRTNVVDEEKTKWFITKGIYTSCHDLISKILQFDVDGDASLVVADTTIINIAERHMKDIVPLFYNMAKAGSIPLNNQIIYRGLTLAYTGGNIGQGSNDITKVWNGENVSLDVIKILCYINNCTIDYAKTLYKPELPKDIKKLISNHTKAKVPYFFMYAKDKHKDNIEKTNNSVVNRLQNIVQNTKFNFKVAGIGKFDYNMLKIKEYPLDQNVIDVYEKLDLKKFSVMSNSEEHANFTYVYFDIRNQILNINPNIQQVVSTLVDYLYSIKNTANKTTFWSSFGDILVHNLQHNVKTKFIYCEECKVLIEKTKNRKYCEPCQKEKQKELDREYRRNKRSVKKNE